MKKEREREREAVNSKRGSIQECVGTKTKIRMIGILFRKGSVYTGLYLIPIPSLLHSLTHTPTLIEYRTISVQQLLTLPSLRSLMAIAHVSIYMYTKQSIK